MSACIGLLLMLHGTPAAISQALKQPACVAVHVSDPTRNDAKPPQKGSKNAKS